MTQLVLLSAMLAIWPFGSGKDFRMTPGTEVPAATGTVQVTRNKENGNTDFDIRVRRLAQPSSLTPPEGVYLVWLQSQGSAPVKAGALGVGRDLKGQFKSVTVSKDFNLFVTAEQGEYVAQPSGPEVLRTHIRIS